MNIRLTLRTYWVATGASLAFFFLRVDASKKSENKAKTIIKNEKRKHPLAPNLIQTTAPKNNQDFEFT